MFRKCDFYQTQMHYLGHVISKEGIVVYQETIKGIMKWLVPKDLVDIKYFMGITCYYRRFIQGFYKLAYLITSLHKKGTKFDQNKKCQENFEKLKKLLIIDQR